jgi:serine/threonine protein kinase
MREIITKIAKIKLEPNNLVSKVAIDDGKNFIIKGEYKVLLALERLGIKNVVRPKGVINANESNCLGFYMQYGGQTLTSVARQMSKEQLLSAKSQIFEALEEMAHFGIYHRDVHPTNIGIKFCGKNVEAKLFDFSLSWIKSEDIRWGRQSFKHPHLGKNKKLWDFDCDRYALDVSFAFFGA